MIKNLTLGVGYHTLLISSHWSVLSGQSIIAVLSATTHYDAEATRRKPLIKFPPLLPVPRSFIQPRIIPAPVGFLDTECLLGVGAGENVSPILDGIWTLEFLVDIDVLICEIA